MRPDATICLERLVSGGSAAPTWLGHCRSSGQAIVAKYSSDSIATTFGPDEIDAQKRRQTWLLSEYPSNSTRIEFPALVDEGAGPGCAYFVSTFLPGEDTYRLLGSDLTSSRRLCIESARQLWLRMVTAHSLDASELSAESSQNYCQQMYLGGLEGVSKAIANSIPTASAAKRALFARAIKINGAIMPGVEQLVASIKECSSCLSSLGRISLSAFCHGDLHFGNIIQMRGRFGLIDPRPTTACDERRDILHDGAKCWFSYLWYLVSINPSLHAIASTASPAIPVVDVLPLPGCRRRVQRTLELRRLHLQTMTDERGMKRAAGASRSATISRLRFLEAISLYRAIPECLIGRRNIPQALLLYALSVRLLNQWCRSAHTRHPHVYDRGDVD